MRRVPSRDTSCEMALRRALWQQGLRYRCCVTGLPGKPDIVFAGSHVAVTVNGCFWHGHLGCKRARIPRENADYWRKKIDRNSLRDGESARALNAIGWHVIVAWECEINSNVNAIVQRIDAALKERASHKRVELPRGNG